MDPDVALARRLAADLDGAFPALVVAHADRLYTIALRCLGLTGDAEEVAQDALVRAYRALATYERDRIHELRLRPWLATITINLARNRRRRIADLRPASPLEPLVAGGFDVRAPDSAGPIALAERHESRQALVEALGQVPLAMREAIVLRHVDGLSLAETATALGRPEGTIKAQVHRGLRQLRLALAAESPAEVPAQAQTTEMTA
ncbi:MAG: RNA polymerase sigma factor [Candidatus Limnocylindrales bacterium]